MKEIIRISKKEIAEAPDKREDFLEEASREVLGRKNFFSAVAELLKKIFYAPGNILG